MPLDAQQLDTEISPGYFADNRNTAYGSQYIHFSLPWSEQLSTWLLIWTIFLGYHLVIKNDAELTIDAIHFKNHTAQLLLEILRDFCRLP